MNPGTNLLNVRIWMNRGRNLLNVIMNFCFVFVFTSLIHNIVTN